MRSWLSLGGAASAALVGAAVALGTGWRGLALLFAFFLTSSALTRGGGHRTAAQVAANGGVAAAAALLALLDPHWRLAFAGALAAATADTWSTEIGGRSRATPRLVTSWAPVTAGTSGGVTGLGSLGGAAGATLIALVAQSLALASWPAVPWIAAGGIGGALADSLLGATVQARFRCERCGSVGETLRCPCGGTGAPYSGLPWLANDAVNLACTLVGAAIACAPVLVRIVGLG